MPANPGDSTRDTDVESNGPLRTLRVLEALAGLEQPVSLLSVAAATKLPKMKAYRALHALQSDGFIDHVGRDGYRLGTRALALAALIGPRPPLVATARAVLNELAVMSSESVTLHLRSGSHRVLVLGAEALGQPQRHPVIIGERAPLTSGCSGMVILAHLPEQEADEVIKRRPRRERRPDRNRLAEIRKDGYALSFSDNHAGLNGVAVPLLDPLDGWPMGSIAIAGDETRLPEPALRRLSEPLKSACKKLTPQLAKMVGPHATQRLQTLDVTIQRLLHA